MLFLTPQSACKPLLLDNCSTRNKAAYERPQRNLLGSESLCVQVHCTLSIYARVFGVEAFALVVPSDGGCVRLRLPQTACSLG